MLLSSDDDERMRAARVTTMKAARVAIHGRRKGGGVGTSSRWSYRAINSSGDFQHPFRPGMAQRIEELAQHFLV